jgi:hypothetical protein
MTARLSGEQPSIGSMVAEYAPIAWPYWFVFITVYAEALRLSLKLWGGNPERQNAANEPVELTEKPT